eukprot:756509-Hanusia_phi.AAC.1
MLGQGGQGAVYLGSYDGNKVTVLARRSRKIWGGEEEKEGGDREGKEEGGGGAGSRARKEGRIEGGRRRKEEEGGRRRIEWSSRCEWANGDVQVAGKEMLEGPTPQVLEDLKNEVELLMQLNHPNCHFLLGAKVHSDSEGFPLLLTELHSHLHRHPRIPPTSDLVKSQVCDEGSVFDLYAKKKLFFPEQTAVRLPLGSCPLKLLHTSGGSGHKQPHSLRCSWHSAVDGPGGEKLGITPFRARAVSKMSISPSQIVAIVMFGQQSVYDK